MAESPQAIARIGISGWRYAPWRGDFYPAGLRQKDELKFAARHFNSIELNGSFYSLQYPERYVQWYRDVPEDFVFAVKGSRYITHMLKLRGVERALANFFASGLFELREKLGPILWQLPPQLAFDRDRLARFFALLPASPADAARLARRHDARVAGRARLVADPRMRLRHALEVRHPSFACAELVDLLREHGVALVVADTAAQFPFLEDVTADFVYVRLHGAEKIYESGYTDAALDAWARKIVAWLDGREPRGAQRVARPAPRRVRRDVFVYFDNDIKVRAPYDAQALARKVAAGLRRRPRAVSGGSAPAARPSYGGARRARRRG